MINKRITCTHYGPINARSINIHTTSIRIPRMARHGIGAKTELAVHYLKKKKKKKGTQIKP